MKDSVADRTLSREERDALVALIEATVDVAAEWGEALAAAVRAACNEGMGEDYQNAARRSYQLAQRVYALKASMLQLLDEGLPPQREVDARQLVLPHRVLDGEAES